MSAATRPPHPPTRAAPQDSPSASALPRQRSMPKVKIAMDAMVSNLAATLSSTSGTFVMPLTSFPASSGRSKLTKKRNTGRSDGATDKYAQRCEEVQTLTHMCRVLRGLLYGVPDAEQRRRQEILSEEHKSFAAAVCRAFGVAAGLIASERRSEIRNRHHSEAQKRREEVSLRRSQSPDRSILSRSSTTVSNTTAADSSFIQASPSPRTRGLQLLFLTPVNPGVPPRSGSSATAAPASPSLAGNRPTTPINAVSTPQGWIPSPSPIGRRHRHMGEVDSPVAANSLY
ncbi:Hypothetical protein, putative [Bodo saltans]|uniref:Uncharacterized protein n=1 Tax=Bodo saltans TaxID=75058 RepID=A0A0S4J3N0_BODSA|nr:Hypothetical protein, putative [Bodo saltans]|eukprot:CUG86025.1 Hypothetical protein, putative [Bodo saltans]